MRKRETDTERRGIEIYTEQNRVLEFVEKKTEEFA